jgi:hypothetical protein
VGRLAIVNSTTHHAALEDPRTFAWVQGASSPVQIGDVFSAASVERIDGDTFVVDFPGPCGPGQAGIGIP